MWITRYWVGKDRFVAFERDSRTLPNYIVMPNSIGLSGGVYPAYLKFIDLEDLVPPVETTMEAIVDEFKYIEPSGFNSEPQPWEG